MGPAGTHAPSCFPKCERAIPASQGNPKFGPVSGLPDLGSLTRIK